MDLAANQGQYAWIGGEHVVAECDVIVDERAGVPPMPRENTLKGNGAFQEPSGGLLLEGYMWWSLVTRFTCAECWA